ncbi:hypothetical protein QTP88_024209 [Uroleucon formosanum]
MVEFRYWPQVRSSINHSRRNIVGTKRENATVTYTSCPVYRDIADTRIRNMRDHFRCEKLPGRVVVLHACNRRSEIGVIIIIMRLSMVRFLDNFL